MDHIATLMMDSFASKIMALVAILIVEIIAPMQVTIKLLNLDSTALQRIQLIAILIVDKCVITQEKMCGAMF
jgi:hypothetical protein